MHSVPLLLRVKQGSGRNELALLLFRLLTRRLCHPEPAESCPEIKPLGKRRGFFSPRLQQIVEQWDVSVLSVQRIILFLKYAFCEIFCDLQAV